MLALAATLSFEPIAFAQPDTCTPPWVANFCREAACERAKRCRGAVIATWAGRRRRLCQSDTATARDLIEKACDACNDRYCPSSGEKRRLKSGGRFCGGGNRLVYRGPFPKCYNVKLVKILSGSSGGFWVQVDNRPEMFLRYEGDSVDVCGKTIELSRGTAPDDDCTTWQATEGSLGG